ncbi:MAG: hypothetical protein ACQ5SW_02540 [Sphaerochaetaceae bacterium]
MLRAYLPHIMQDKAEPFALSAIGTRVYTETGRSHSFRRILVVPSGCQIIEFQMFWVYDIQHLYDLEHIWVTTQNERVVQVEASFHGRYLNASNLAAKREDGKYVLYCQPGKHAFLPEGRLFQLLPDPVGCCNTQAGEAGLLVMDLFSAQLETDKARNIKVKSYIKEHFAFHPTWVWEEMDTSQVPLLSWEVLKVHIVESVRRELKVIEG